MSNPSPAVVPEEDSLGFAPEIDVPTRYMQRTRDFYLTLGYGNPYRWAQYADVPFTPMSKPLSECRVGIVSTAARFDPALGDQGPGAAYNAGAKFYTPYAETTDEIPDLRISHVGYDRNHTTAEDQKTWFPLERMREADAEGRIGEISPRFYGAPTNRSQRVTLEVDAPQILEWAREDKVDVAVVIAT